MKIDLNKIGYKMYLDDIRDPVMTYPETLNLQWCIVRSYTEFVDEIKTKGMPKFISFDHDLASEHYPIMEKDGGLSNGNRIPYETYRAKTGYDCAKWLVEYCMDRGLKLPICKVHSMNPVGRRNIQSYLENAERVMEE